jgi:hypothetical protein
VPPVDNYRDHPYVSEYVREYIPESDQEMEPYYKCESCGCQVGLIFPTFRLSLLSSPNLCSSLLISLI